MIQKIEAFAKKLDGLALLLLRLVMAYGLFNPALMKWKNMQATADWFASMNYPFPLLNAYLAGITEMLGVILLVLGFGIRLITPLLMFVMIIAISTVHIANGFNAGTNGFEIPLYYLIIFFSLFVFGGGKYSLDNLLKKKR